MSKRKHAGTIEQVRQLLQAVWDCFDCCEEPLERVLIFSEAVNCTGEMCEASKRDVAALKARTASRAVKASNNGVIDLAAARAARL